jgi:hypothetical protein
LKTLRLFMVGYGGVWAVSGARTTKRQSRQALNIFAERIT